MEKVGICAMGAYIPVRRLSVAETINNWKNSSIELVKNKFKVTARSVLSSDEDVVTLANESSQRCFRNTDFKAKDVNSVFFGTVTASELFRGCSNLLMESLSDNKNYFSSDIASADKSGIAALIMAYSSVSAAISETSLAIGTDVLCRHTAPGDLRESYEGAGAASCLIGKQKVIAEIIGCESFNSDFPEIGRPEDERFIRVLMPMDSGLLKVGMIEHVTSAIKLYCQKHDAKLEDFDYFVLPQQYPGQTIKLAKLLGIPLEKIEKSLFSQTTGDTGSASALIGLEKTLEKADSNKRILLCSYGHNSGADIVEFKTTEYLETYQNIINNKIEQSLKSTINVSYAEALRLEYKLVEPNISIGTFN